MKSPDSSNLKRPIQPMPESVATALRDHLLEGVWSQRPAYQRNDYLSWINRAVRNATKTKRLEQILHELEAGDVYMGMPWKRRK